MEISPRRSLSLDASSAATQAVAAAAASSYPPTYGNCRGSIYAMEGLMNTTSSSIENPGIRLPYKMSSAMSVDSATMKNLMQPKKENFITSMFGAITSLVFERFTRPGTFMSNISNTLSVTVVPNEGIIPQDFFKNLTRSCEQLAIEQQNNRHCGKREENCACANGELSKNHFYDLQPSIKQIYEENTVKSALSAHLSLEKEDFVPFEPQDKVELTEDRKKSSVANIADSAFPITENPEEKDITAENTQGLDVRIKLVEAEDLQEEIFEQEKSTRIPEIEENPETQEISTVEEAKVEKNEIDSISMGKTMTSNEPMDAWESSGRPNWQEMWRCVVGGISGRSDAAQRSLESPEVPRKKPNLAKPRRKNCTMARGKGRAKSQLRRNGVSQSRHRKERTKQNIYSNIQDDLEAWEESSSELIEDSDEEKDSSTFSKCSSFNLLDNLPFGLSTNSCRMKERTRDGKTNFPALRVRYLPECSMEVDDCRIPSVDETDSAKRVGDYRPRLVSESSVDSEDSCFIVFENGSESDYTENDSCDGLTEQDFSEDSDDEDDVGDDKDDVDGDKTIRKVRFNMTPVVHTMIHWDYAYRAARLGPWETMMRDRVRFRDRIRAIGKILNPILSSNHRSDVWRDRFDVQGNE